MVIGVTGMPGAGKDTVRDIVRKYGFPVIVMGDEVRAEAARRNLEPTPENLGKVMLQIRAEEGPEALAKRCIPKIKALNAKVVIVDGLRSPHEVREFRKEFPNFKVIAIHASPKTRFKRLLRRGRSDDPKDWEAFYTRDQRELSVGIGEVIATADYMIVNEGSIERLKREIKRVIEKVISDEQNNKQCRS
ncbi:flagellar hook-basal body complex protein FliE [Candidatus Bathyarchaeota archaeon]|nr:flagellar hook-basal body complex protein FliE [Candidatus Bathyarchaeota archaeon]